MTLVSGTIIVMVISIAAGSTIPVWGFAIFAFVVATGWGALSLVEGSSLVAAALSTIGILVLMEVCYLVGVFLFGLWRRARKLPKNGSVADRAPATNKHRQS
ncbi:hypothetical protein N8E89_24195 (plasmid) [Phyllobacterium sp. A18/5-2]|uniref:hypothetical protein n=1 Tax=Phyllobacterium sp. A18/5-2 TaxID=2978392 RepID=UPI0021C9A26A|nr:hypothetical protein [Phyllobacterium sp. A18/5-2]UXN67278.1 hypothetical protein N8E89_24195 [Phyllobacterium sp. A18/5-2]